METATDIKQLRQCMGKFATGVTVVTYCTEEGVRGTTMNSFTSVSLDPPLVLISVARTAKAAAGLDGKPFSINVLGAHQADLATHFAGRQNPDIRIAWDEASEYSDVPTLKGAIAAFQCKPWRQYNGGDHVLILGEVTSSHVSDGEPLLFFQGRFMNAES